jgi:hypothetical protein
MRPVAILGAIVAGVAATAASNPSTLNADITGSSDSFTTTLDASSPSDSQGLRAVLSTSEALEEGSGLVNLVVDFTPESSGQVRCTLESVTTGEVNGTDVLSVSDQPSVDIGIDAFGGCEGNDVDCGESFLVTFERLEENIDTDVVIDWSLQGAASLVESDAGEPTDPGTITFSVE